MGISSGCCGGSQSNTGKTEHRLVLQHTNNPHDFNKDFFNNNQTFFDYKEAKIDYKFRQISDAILLIRSCSAVSPYKNVTQSLVKKRINLKSEAKKHYQVVGFGKKPLNCTGVYFKQYCKIGKSCDYLTTVMGNCRKAVCPDCFQDWINTIAGSVVKKVLAFRRYNLFQDKRLRYSHFIVSLPEEQRKLPRKKQEAIARKILKKHGIVGAIEVFHPHRFKKEKKKELRKLAKDNNIDIGDDSKFWKTLRKLHIGKKIKDYYDFLNYSPHFHYIGAYHGLFKYSKNKGYVIKKVGKHDLFKQDMLDGVQPGTTLMKVARYILSHTGVHYSGGMKVKYLGCFSNAKFSMNLLSPQEQDVVFANARVLLMNENKEDGFGVCPKCGGPLEDMENLVEDLKNFDEPKQKRLLLANGINTGRLPPPDKKQLDFILNITG